MSRKAIKERFDEIVAFAGVERFLDMPVKRYSSGMFVRLAFSVAAHLDADILLIDEVLAVGDAEFQKKCLSRMESIAKSQSRSIIFVSHNMGAINSLCDRVAWINQGKLMATGEPQEVIDRYLKGLEELNAHIPISDRKDREGDGRAKLVDLRIGQGSVKSGESLQLDFAWQHQESVLEQRLDVHLFNSRGNYLSSFRTSLTADKRSAQLSLPDLPLMPGKFFVNVHLFLDGIRADFVGRAAYFDVISEVWQSNEVVVERQNPGVELKHHWS